MKILRVEDPTNLSRFLVWVEKDENDDWSRLPDAVYRDKVFAPNKICVIVVRSGRQFWSDWSQAREEYTVEGREDCKGTHAFGGPSDTPRERRPRWAREAEEFAINAVKGI